jgi:hypothetical protein
VTDRWPSVRCTTTRIGTQPTGGVRRARVENVCYFNYLLAYGFFACTHISVKRVLWKTKQKKKRWKACCALVKFSYIVRQHYITHGSYIIIIITFAHYTNVSSSCDYQEFRRTKMYKSQTIRVPKPIEKKFASSAQKGRAQWWREKEKTPPVWLLIWASE